MAVSALLWLGGGRANAGNMTLTPAGIAQGFTLSTFATGFVFGPGGTGPTGIAYPGAGVVLVADSNNGKVYRFPTDTDGQAIASATVLGPYFEPFGLVSFNGVTAMVLHGTGSLVTLDTNTGSTSLIVTGLPAAVPAGPLDVVANPLNGHYFVSNGSASPGLVDVNPLTHTFTEFAIGGDGLTITPDGKTVYEASNNMVLGFDTATGAQVYQSSPIPTVDGTGLGFGTLAGKLFANTNTGNVVEIDLASNTQTLIATGGSRGDFAKADPYNGSLLLTQSDSVLRLTPPPGGGFGSPVPEPSKLALVACGGAAVAALHWRRKRQPA
jgi:hypothetical protein